jgi:hypothetical protein
MLIREASVGFVKWITVTVIVSFNVNLLIGQTVSTYKPACQARYDWWLDSGVNGAERSFI